MSSKLNRRQFLRTAAGAAIAPTIVPASVLGLGQTPPSERIAMGFVGLGSRGFNLLHDFLREEGTQVVAVCDVDEKHYRDNEWGQGRAFGREPARQMAEKFYARREDKGGKASVEAYDDFRDVCGREDIDAVVVGTPDHWHALCTLEALRQGKDVYCEKPLTHTFHEGQLVYREAQKRNAVFQAGSQQRSGGRFREAVELVLNGRIGKVVRVEVGLPEGYNLPQDDPTITAPPDHLDYEFWCGPSRALPYMRARHHRWWRGNLAYGGGTLMDWIGHHNDIAHWGLGMDNSGPVRVEAVGWTAPETDIYNAPHQYEIRCEYEGGITSSIGTGNRGGAKWIGEDGWVYVDRGGIEVSNPEWVAEGFDRGPIKAYDSSRHTLNFLECVRSRKACIAPAETAHRSVTPGHLAYVSNALGRALKWDPARERVLEDPEADRLLHEVSYREPWELPG